MTVDFSPNPLLAVGCVDGSVLIYSINGGYCTHAFPKHRDRIGMVKFHPLRLLLLSTSEDGDIRIYDLHRHS